MRETRHHQTGWDEHDDADDCPAAVRDAVRGLARAEPPDAAAVARVMTAVRQRPRPRRQRLPRIATRWPIADVLAASVLVAAIVGQARVAQPPPAPVAPVAERVVHFTLRAPQATRVVLVGDFNAWNVGATPMRRDDASGTWTVALRLPSGLYAYSFVLDGERWTADPDAALAPADGFGQPNSLVVVGMTESTT